MRHSGRSRISTCLLVAAPSVSPFKISHVLGSRTLPILLFCARSSFFCSICLLVHFLAPSLRQEDGESPKNLRNALKNEAGLSYPTFSGTSMTLSCAFK